MNADSQTVLKTIYALASPSGRSGVAVLRVSGAQAFESLDALTSGAAFKPQEMQLATLSHPKSGAMIDRTLCVTFQSPRSYTGEDVVEYHLHGSAAIIDEMLDVLSNCAGHRMAEPGEFTRRAFENGKMDLTQAEAVADLIDAQTRLQKSQALSQMGGALSQLYEGWSESLKTALAHLEADIEFPDEDMPDGVAPEAMTTVKTLYAEIADHLNDNRQGERLREGIHIAIIGAPNAGKSSLVNALAQRDIAIVSDLAGTTRDIIEAHLNLGGYPVIISDTAGLRPEQVTETGHDAIESEGIRRALSRAQDADLKILLFDGTDAPDQATMDLKDENALIVVNKGDLKNVSRETFEGQIQISAKTGDGLGDLTNALVQNINRIIGSKSQDTPSLTRARHRDALTEAHDALSRSTGAVLPELMAEDLRLAIRGIGRITGRVDVEDLLDVIFNDFCIGK